jgi:hypothetical protein
MTKSLRQPVLRLQPDFDKFLFATVGDETEGVPLSVVSALARLGLDPWEEAGRLSSLSHREAVEQLARLIAELPGSSRHRDEARKISRGLIGLLPTREVSRVVSQIQIRPPFSLRSLPGSSHLWAVCLVLAVAVAVSAIIHGGLPFGIGSP